MLSWSLLGILSTTILNEALRSIFGFVEYCITLLAPPRLRIQSHGLS